jgi:hypothetical protein
MAEAVGAQEHGQRDAAANVPSQIVERLVRGRDVVGTRAVGEHPQHLAHVRLRAGEQLREQVVVVDRRDLRNRRNQVLRHTAAQLRGGRQQLGRGVLHRGARPGLVGHGSHLCAADRAPAFVVRPQRRPATL